MKEAVVKSITWTLILSALILDSCTQAIELRSRNREKGISIGNRGNNRRNKNTGGLFGTSKKGQSFRHSSPSQRGNWSKFGDKNADGNPEGASSEKGHFDVKQAVDVSIAVVLPHSMFKEREYKKMIYKSSQAVTTSASSKFNQIFKLKPYLEMLHPIPAPTEVLQKICDQFLIGNTSIILYMTYSENYGRHSMASQYFLQLAQYVKIPVISWNADNSGFEQTSHRDRMQLQLAPTIKHQVAASLALMERYGWHMFSIITGKIAGHTNFEQVVREMVAHSNMFKKTILDSLIVNDPSKDLQSVSRTEARVFLLYSTKEEAKEIMEAADKLKLTGKNYVWIVTQSVIGNELEAADAFPVGMLGIHFATDPSTMIEQIKPGFEIIGQALESLIGAEKKSFEEIRLGVQSDISCDSPGEVQWSRGENLFKLLNQVSVGDVRNANNNPVLEFDVDGSRKSVELKIVNLQSQGRDGRGRRWEEIGVWQSWGKKAEGDSPSSSKSSDATLDKDKEEMSSETGFLDIKDIVWPGNALKPPEGLPEKRFIRVSFLEEDPYVMLSPPSTCRGNKGVICQMVDDSLLKGVNVTEEQQKANSSLFQCCSGFCVDLLLKFAEDLSFDFQLVRVKDGNWGGIVNGQWNGLVKELIHHETDIVMTSLKINSGRESVIDFSVPFLETGITILVAKRTGIISPTAFLEPFDTASWMLVALVAIQVAAGCIFLFEWLSPSGYDMKVQHPQGRFSLLRTLWLVWAVLFQAAVNVDCPRGYTSRFMAYIWAMFALIFLAIYTANLAAFMITREEFPNLSGLEDRRLTNPNSEKPPFRFGTIPNGATDYVMKNNFPEMHSYMKHLNRSTVKLGFRAVKNDELDAFIYDATVLEYLVGQDDECNILTVGSWYAMTGYGVAFPKGSKWIPQFNGYLMKYKENGDLERMQRFWFTGACEPRKRRRTSSKPLALAQFLSAFLLLGIGISLSAFLLLCEHGYFSYLRPYLKKIGRGGWCALISLSVAESLKKEDDRFSVKGQAPRSRVWGPASKCKDPLCERSIEHVSKELEMANNRINLLQQKLWQTLDQTQTDKQQQQQQQQHLDECCYEEDQPRLYINAATLDRNLRRRGHICSTRRKYKSPISEFETVL